VAGYYYRTTNYRLVSIWAAEATATSFLVTINNGKWSKPLVFSNLSTRSSWFTSISCPKVNNCTAVGQYAQEGIYPVGVNAPNYGAFEVTEVNGKWSNAWVFAQNSKIPYLTSISCVPFGSGPICTVAGFTQGSALSGPFLDVGMNNSWNSPEKLWSSDSQPFNGQMTLNSISCPDISHCTAVGSLGGTATAAGAVILEETNGTWSVPLLQNSINKLGINPTLTSVSCPSFGNCSAIGSVLVAHRTPFTDWTPFNFYIQQKSGVWGSPVPISNLDASSVASGQTYSSASSISCSSNFVCLVGGSYTNSPSSSGVAFLTSVNNGVWSNIGTIPGTNGPQSHSWISSIYCVASNACIAVGAYEKPSNLYTIFEGFFITKNNLGH